MANPRNISNSSKEVAKTLLKLQAIQINVDSPFTWTSGISSPIYCNNRIVISDVPARKLMVNVFVEFIKEKCADAEIIAGIATGGMPLGALIADKLDLPFIYVRPERKEHGLKKQVEGAYKPGNKIVLIEDHISTGGSSIKAVHAIREEKLELLGLFSLLTYSLDKAAKLFSENNVKNYSLSDLDEILDVALEENLITQDDKAEVLKFRDSLS